MSIRHIHARPGQHIVVHRNGTSGSDAKGILALIVIAGLFIAYNLEAILTFLLWVFLTCLIGMLALGALWLLWTYRAPIWRGVCWTARMLRRGVCWAAPKVWFGICWAAQMLRRGVCWAVSTMYDNILALSGRKRKSDSDGENADPWNISNDCEYSAGNFHIPSLTMGDDR